MAEIDERTPVISGLLADRQKRGKMFVFLLIVLAILVFMLGFSLLAAYIVAIHRMGGRGY